MRGVGWGEVWRKGEGRQEGGGVPVIGDGGGGAVVAMVVNVKEEVGGWS